MQNCVALGRLVTSGIYDDYWVQPVPHDAGSAWGAALLSAAKRQRPGIREIVDTAFLGRPITDQDIEATLEVTGLTAHRSPNPTADAALALGQGKIVGWVRGRAEVGPRALGGRSLLAYPGFALNHFRLNRIKSREYWRPLAPVYLEEDLNQYVTGGTSSPHMNLSFPVRPDVAVKLPVAVHVDGSARIQTVRSGDPGKLSNILQELKKQSLDPCIINTSFNGAGEPLVQTAVEALRFYLTSELDILFLGDRCVDQKPHVADELRSALRANPFLERYRRLAAGHRVILLRSPRLNSLTEVISQLVQSLAWIGIDIEMHPASALAGCSDERPLLVMTLEPAVDLAELPVEILTELQGTRWLFISDNLYPTAIPLQSIADIISMNKARLRTLVDGRRCVLWMTQEECHHFTLEVPELGEQSLSLDLPHSSFNPYHDYLILSWSNYQSYRYELSSLRPFEHFSVWLTRHSLSMRR